MPTVFTPTRIKLQNILFATDLTESAAAVFLHALDVARHYGASLFTVNVMPHQPFVEAVEPDPERMRAMAKQRLATWARSEGFKGIAHKELIAEGEVAEVLADLARKYDIDLIVIGTGGRKGLKKLLLGSVAEEVFRTAECPVLTVGPHAVRWDLDGKLQHILYATDFGPESMHALPYAISMAEESRARLTLLHVAPEPGMALPEPEPGSRPVVSAREASASTFRQLRALIPEGEQLWHEPEYQVEFGQPTETILSIAAQDVDMIVLGAKRPAALTKHLGAGVAYKIASEAPCPVLSVGTRYHE